MFQFYEINYERIEMNFINFTWINLDLSYLILLNLESQTYFNNKESNRCECNPHI